MCVPSLVLCVCVVCVCSVCYVGGMWHVCVHYVGHMCCLYHRCVVVFMCCVLYAFHVCIVCVVCYMCLSWGGYVCVCMCVNERVVFF